MRGSTNADGSTITNANVTTFREFGNFVFRTGPTNAQERLIIEAGGTSTFLKGVEGGTDETLAKFIPDGAAELYYDNSKKFETTSAGVTVSGDLTFSDSVANDINLRGGKIYGDDGALPAFTIQNTSGNANHAKIIIGANNSDNGGIEFYGAGSSSSDLKMTIRGNTDTVEIPDNHKFVCGNGSDLQIYHDGQAVSYPHLRAHET